MQRPVQPMRAVQLPRGRSAIPSPERSALGAGMPGRGMPLPAAWSTGRAAPRAAVECSHWRGAQITQAGQDGSQCGIGVVFRMDNHGALVVDSLVPGGPAWESSTQGGLQVADVLQTVDGKNVYR